MTTTKLPNLKKPCPRCGLPLAQHYEMLGDDDVPKFEGCPRRPVVIHGTSESDAGEVTYHKYYVDYAHKCLERVTAPGVVLKFKTVRELEQAAWPDGGECECCGKWRRHIYAWGEIGVCFVCLQEEQRGRTWVAQRGRYVAYGLLEAEAMDAALKRGELDEPPSPITGRIS
jgi:hypothetical protein